MKGTFVTIEPQKWIKMGGVAFPLSKIDLNSLTKFGLIKPKKGSKDGEMIFTKKLY